ncbi:g9464 [Coccomyxa elongata]
MDDIGLQDDDQRDFSWSRHYPGDEGFIDTKAGAGSNGAPKSENGVAGPVDQPVEQSVKGEEPAPFLEHVELPGSYHSAHPPIRADQPSPEPPAAAHRAPASTPQPPQPADEPLPESRLAAPATAVSSAAPATSPASANGRTHAGATGGGGGGSLRAPSSAPAEDDGSGTDTDEDGELIAKARQKALMERQRAAAVKRRGKPRAGGGITLKLLIDEGVLQPGDNVLSVEYKSSMTYANLEPDGRISCFVQGQHLTFESPSAFSIYLKRLVNPARKADDGWKTVKCNGRFLEQYKLELARRRFGKPDDDSAGASTEAPEQKRPRTSVRTPSESNLGRSGPGMQQQSPRAMANGYSGDYVKSRPKRQIKPPARNSSYEEEHQMVPCTPYRNPPGGEGRDCQPFHVVVAPAAQLMMDFHAHLSTSEVIGILGGSWDHSSQTVRVARAVPVREIPIEDGSINVEMDPEDNFRAVESLSNAKLKCVGWYHSHPHFAAHPSIIDIKNQVAQQFQYRDEDGAETYIAAIVAPYDDQLQGNASTLNWFHVAHEPGRIPAPEQDPLQAGCRNMCLQVDTDDEAATLLPLQTEMVDLARRYAGMEARAEMQREWRNGQKRCDKLRGSLESRIPKSWPSEMTAMFLNRVTDAVVTAFNEAGPPAKKAAAEDDVEISELTEDDPAVSRHGDGEEVRSRAKSGANGVRNAAMESEGSEDTQ